MAPTTNSTTAGGGGGEVLSRSIQWLELPDKCPVVIVLVFTMTLCSLCSSSRQGLNIVAIVVPTVVLGVLAVALVALVWLLCVVKKKRQTEGTYRPSAEEQSGARSVEMPDALKLPKEERLI